MARAVARRTDPDPSDGQLLGRYVRSQDGPAFAELVRRHGPMVLGVCRRVAGDHHLAEDAFQAAFVVLARRAADVTPREAVRPWLYGVAVRVAREARTMLARRRAREVSVPVVPDRGVDTPGSPENGELVALVDEEVGRLPDHLRAAVVLCELGGVGRKDAAARLGIPEGTLSSRLGKARKVLAARLKARGVALPAAGLAVLAEVAVSPRLLASTSAAITAARPLPAAVAALSNGAIRTMLVQKLKLLAAGGLAVAVVAGGLSLAAGPSKAGPAAGAKPAAGQVPVAKAEPPEQLSAPVVYKDLMLVLVTKDGAAAVVFGEADGDVIPYKYRYESADGRTTKAGDAKLFDRFVPLEQRPDGSSRGYRDWSGPIKAGPIELDWSMGGRASGWIYYRPEEVTVHPAHAKNFEAGTERSGRDTLVHSKLDLKRFMRK
ncbi:MAG: sigma-70 family RNA polymerase sigma factor [Gemmataceae bacterium]|nr:sigma-70 family RNA polymerase sigma factor [Gemmataceae bacterium]